MADEDGVAARADPQRLAVERVDGERGGIPVLETGAVEMGPRGAVVARMDHAAAHAMVMVWMIRKRHEQLAARNDRSAAELVREHLAPRRARIRAEPRAALVGRVVAPFVPRRDEHAVALGHHGLDCADLERGRRETSPCRGGSRFRLRQGYGG